MKKNCINCMHVKLSPLASKYNSDLFAKCICPEANDKYTFCNTQRMDIWLFSVIQSTCGQTGRYWAKK